MSMSLHGISEFEPENPFTLVISPEASADDYLTAAVRSEFDRATVTLTGELDIATVGKFESSLTEAEQMSSTVVLDLRGLEFIDCAGLHSFISARKRITASGGAPAVRPGAPGGSAPVLLDPGSHLVRLRRGRSHRLTLHPGVTSTGFSRITGKI
jgi:anti-anti-sigma factor